MDTLTPLPAQSDVACRQIYSTYIQSTRFGRSDPLRGSIALQQQSIYQSLYLTQILCCKRSELASNPYPPVYHLPFFLRYPQKNAFHRSTHKHKTPVLIFVLFFFSDMHFYLQELGKRFRQVQLFLLIFILLLGETTCPVSDYSFLERSSALSQTILISLSRYLNHLVRLLHVLKPFVAVMPEVASPDRKVSEKKGRQGGVRWREETLFSFNYAHSQKNNIII